MTLTGQPEQAEQYRAEVQVEVRPPSDEASHFWGISVARRSARSVPWAVAISKVREHATHRLVTDLLEGGYLTRSRIGTRNFYELHPNLPLRREGMDEVAVGEILQVLLVTESGSADGLEPVTLAYTDRGGLKSR